jgi:hypothetical protein
MNRRTFRDVRATERLGFQFAESGLGLACTCTCEIWSKTETYIPIHSPATDPPADPRIFWIVARATEFQSSIHIARLKKANLASKLQDLCRAEM